MVYTSPTKVARIVTLYKQEIPHTDISQNIGIHHDRTTVACILKHFEKCADFYHINPKTGRPRQFNVHDGCVAARMLAQGEATNVTEVQKKA